MQAPPPPSPLVPPPRAWQLERPPPTHINPWPLLVASGRAAGILLIFVGTLVAVAFASVPGSCFTTPSTCTGFLTQAANALIAAKLLWALGLFCLAGASGVRLQGGMMMKSPSMGDDSGVKAPHVWANLLVLLLSIFLLAVLLLTVSSTIP